MQDNWVVSNLQYSINTWNNKLNEIYSLLTLSPEEFKGGGIWNAIVTINGALQAIGLALIVIFFLIGIIKTCGSFAEVKKPEMILKLFIRFAISKGVVTYGLDLMLSIFKITQGIVTTIMGTTGVNIQSVTAMPQQMIDTIKSVGFFESIPLWSITIIRWIINKCFIICNDTYCIW